MTPVEILTFDELLERGWSLDDALAEAFRLEFMQFEDGAYTVARFAEMHAGPGGLCTLLFPADRVEPGQGWGVQACAERQSRDGAVAHQVVTIAVEPAMTGRGLGPLLDERCEELALARGYRLRVLRSRAPASIYARYGNRTGGSLHGEATRFALKRGFRVMAAEQALDFFGDDIARLITDDVVLGETVLRNCIIAESRPREGHLPWYFICMSKAC
jgi:GNAT superfamily N-acetyltransferase